MLNYEEQLKLAKEIKQRPEIKKMFWNARGCFTGAIISILLAMIVSSLIKQIWVQIVVSMILSLNAVIVVTVGRRIFDKYKKSVNEIFVNEINNLNKNEEDKMSNTLKVEEDKSIKMEKWNSLYRRMNILTIIGLSFLFLGGIALLFLPMGAILGVDKWSFSLFNIIKESFEGEENIAVEFMEKGEIPFNMISMICFCVGVTVPFGLLIFFGGKLLLSKDGEKIRKSILNENCILIDPHSPTVKSIISDYIFVIMIIIVCQLLFPFCWISYAKEILVETNIFTLLLGLIFIIVACFPLMFLVIEMLKNKKEYEQLFAAGVTKVF